MKEIRITPTMQLVMLVATLGALVAAVVAQLPEIQRYLKIERM